MAGSATLFEMLEFRSSLLGRSRLALEVAKVQDLLRESAPNNGLQGPPLKHSRCAPL